MSASMAVEFLQRLRMQSAEEHPPPPLLLGTFQAAAFARLCDRVGADLTRSEQLQRTGGIGAPPARATGAIGGTPVGLIQFNIGAPGLAVALETAAAQGASDVLVVGSAGSLRSDLTIGSTVVIDAVDGHGREDGTSHHYVPAGDTVTADEGLAQQLLGAASQRGASPVRGQAWTTDAPYRTCKAGLARHQAAGHSVVEMEAAALFAVGRVLGLRTGLIVAVSDELFGSWTPDGFSDPAYLAALARAADIVVDVVAGLTRALQA